MGGCGLGRVLTTFSKDKTGHLYYREHCTLVILICREQENKTSKEQEELRMAMPRFETEAEKEEKLRIEKELAEFGEVSEAFRLSKPNPR